jgi:hypothetical protein
MEEDEGNDYFAAMSDLWMNSFIAVLMLCCIFLVLTTIGFAVKTNEAVSKTVEQKEQAQGEISNGSAAKIIELKTPEQTGSSKDLSLVIGSDRIIIYYPAMVDVLDPGTEKQLQLALVEMLDSQPVSQIEVLSYLGDEPYSTARHLAFNRAAAAKKYLSVREIAPDKIEAKFRANEPNGKAGGRVEIIFNR